MVDGPVLHCSVVLPDDRRCLAGRTEGGMPGHRCAYRDSVSGGVEDDDGRVGYGRRWAALLTLIFDLVFR
jgi:hypothetical protein